MNPKVLKTIDVSLSVFKYLIAVVVMLSGITTALMPSAVSVTGPVGFIYNSQIILILIGIYIFVSGFLLFYGKITKRKRIVGYGLMMTYTSFIFGTVVQFLAGLPWVGNAIMAFLVGALYLRWKYQKFYVHPANRKRAVRKSDDWNGEPPLYL